MNPEPQMGFSIFLAKRCFSAVAKTELLKAREGPWKDVANMGRWHRDTALTSRMTHFPFAVLR